MNKKTESRSVRIIGGEWRRRLLPVADITGLRPTTDRVRETLFSWLQFDLPSANCLDAFAGSGALGFEAASRGAKKVTLLERDLIAFKNLQIAHTSLLKSEDPTVMQRLQIEQTDALQWLSNPSDQVFDIVFLDPPFVDQLLNHSLEKIVSQAWITDQSLVYIEQDKGQAFDLPAHFQIVKEKQAGQVKFGLYRYSPA